MVVVGVEVADGSVELGCELGEVEDGVSWVCEEEK